MRSAPAEDEEQLSLRIETLADIPSDKIELAKIYARDVPLLSDPNVLYQRCFQLLKLGGLEAEIPRLVVFGQQSMGKTTLLDMIMGGPIGYSSTDTGTKQPVVIMLKPATETHGSGSEENIKCVLKGNPLKIKDLERAMKQIMSSATTISAEELELEISVPGGVHAVFVDLPGIKDDSKEGADITRSVVRNYVQNNPNDLYLLVKKASDDPANWPWSLREFILSPRPKGLGLTPKQTMVVGTRSRDFLIGERNDIRTQAQLLERVRKRCVKDHTEEKERLDFEGRKRAMESQIVNGRQACLDLLSTSFEYGSAASKEALEKAFDYEVFRKDLNTNFQNLLNEQLGVLERRLCRKRGELVKDAQRLERDIADQGSQSVRESIKLFIRELMQIVTELVTGNFMIMRLQDHGNEFLERYGGSVRDNLRDGHQLAMELFPNARHYDPTFLDKTEVQAEKAVRKMDARKDNEKRMKIRKAVAQQVADKEKEKDKEKGVTLDEQLATPYKSDLPAPDRSGEMSPGQFVRFSLVKDDTQMLAFVQSLDDVAVLPDSKAGNVTVSFAFRTASPDSKSPAVETRQSRPVDKSKLITLMPLSFAISPTHNLAKPFLAWRKTIRSDNWIGLDPVMIKGVVDLVPVANPWTSDAAVDAADPTVSRVTTIIAQKSQASVPATVYDGTATAFLVEDVKELKGGPLAAVMHDLPGTGHQVTLDKIKLKADEPQSVAVMELFLDADVVSKSDAGTWNLLTPLQRIAGTSAESKLLSHVSLTYLNSWLKFHVSNLEPDCRYPEQVLLQMLRSAQRIIDQADWKPLVTDLLQSNVQGGLLQLAKLAACASGVALRRILKASFAEVKRQVECGDLTTSIAFLVKNSRFCDEVELSLEEFCRDRSRQCADDIRDLIVDQTQAINFDMVLDIFDGCRQFEAEFLGSAALCDISQDVKEKWELRRQRLGNADIFAKGHAGNLPHDMIYEEVRVHFWVAKTLLASPMTTKLYISFVKDLKDKTQHLASEAKSLITSESSVEQHLLQKTLCEPTSSGDFLYVPSICQDITGRSMPRNEDELQSYYGFSINRDELRNRLQGTRRAEEYVKLALECVTRLRATIHQKGGVDFLTRLEFSSTSNPAQGRIGPVQAPKRSTKGTPGWDTAGQLPVRTNI